MEGGQDSDPCVTLPPFHPRSRSPEETRASASEAPATGLQSLPPHVRPWIRQLALEVPEPTQGLRSSHQGSKAEA
uniref:Uncharacterized protein n=1 Tax=Oryza rufipogon TaxID=4529 RepID=A0A0E0QMX7_ORYRU